MSFITLDDKEQCKGIYTNGKLFFNKLPTGLTHTWKYSSTFDDEEIMFGHLWAEGKSIEQVCPDNLKDSLIQQNKRLDAFFRSFMEAKINLEDNCFFDLVPTQFLLEYCELKSQIVDSVFTNYPKPSNYSFYLKLEKLICKIRSRDLKLDLNKNSINNIIKTNNFIDTLKNCSRSVSYNQFGTKTGRLSSVAKSFPILTMNSDYRSVVKPTNNLFVEIDYNAAEARTLLSLAGKEQPKGDLHEWNAKKLGITRDQAKKGLFAWLYGSKSSEYEKFSELFNTKILLDKFYDGKTVQNPFGRTIEADPFHALNYLVQSTTADLVLLQALEIDQLLSESKSTSFICFIIHDAIFLDITSPESETVNDAINIMSNNKLGVYPVNVSIGSDFGNMCEDKTRNKLCM